MAEPADLNLDELKRRGRRRLIGAIVLALVAAVVVPMLLESEPRPLGEDVSVRIPPVDEGKYVSKIAEGRTKQDAAKPAPATRAPTPAASVAPAKLPPEPAPAVPDAAKAAPDTAPVPATPPVQDAAPRKSLADAEKVMLAPGAGATSAPSKSNGNGAKTAGAAKAAEPPAAKSAAPAKAEVPSKSTDSAAPAPRGGFAVQLAAFSDDKGANALSNKLKRAGFPAFTEAISTSRGTLWRVRVGPYPTREAAAQSRDKLKAEGHAGIVVPAK
ncbi:MAG: SPOR domain-containing protein [Betaproteobacteria bacterium]|nr:SPOR domain-containing protein [Betaproteobacteria bacterium]